MDEPQSYLRIAERSLASAQFLAVEGMRESSAFCSYHAFESLGGALCTYLGRAYPRRHDKKINQFVSASSNVNNRFKHSVAMLAIVFNSLERNKLLYPDTLLGGTVSLPEDRVTDAQAKDLVKRVKGIKKLVKRFLS